MSDPCGHQRAPFNGRPNRGPLNSGLMRPGKSCVLRPPIPLCAGPGHALAHRLDRDGAAGGGRTAARRRQRHTLPGVADERWNLGESGRDALVTPPPSRVSRPESRPRLVALRAANTACAAARSSQKPSGLVNRTNPKGDGRPRPRPRRASARHGLSRLRTVCVSSAAGRSSSAFRLSWLRCWHAPKGGSRAIAGCAWRGVDPSTPRFETAAKHTWPLI